MAGVTADADDRAIAVVGMGVAVPGASNPDELWTTLARPAQFTAPGERFDLGPEPSADSGPADRNRAGLGGFMHDFRPHPKLAAELAGSTPPRRNPAVLWLRHCLLHALTGVTVQPRDRVGVVAGLNVNSSPPLEESLLVDAVAAALAAGSPMSKSGTARTIRCAFPSAQDEPRELFPHRAVRQACADLLPSGYDVLVIDAACSPGLYAVDLGAKAVRAGEYDLALCGACCVLSRLYLVLSCKAQALSRSGTISALDAAADGTVFSDGAAVLALKQYRRARADGDSILGFVRGFGGSSDGRGKAVQAPSTAGQSLALRRAWQSAGVGPGDVDWILAHAAGTPAGDRTEIATLTACADANTHWAVTAPKSAIGHTGQASGVVAAVHALLGLRHSLIPAQPQYTTALDSALDGSCLRVPARDEPWPPSAGRPRMAGISAFGVGGTDAHLLIADRPARPGRSAPADQRLVIVQWAAHLPGQPDRKAVRHWLGGAAPSWPATFGDRYPQPDPRILRLPPSVLARIDRTQLMTAECADALWRMLGDAATRLRPETGVFVGHSGPVRGDSAAVLHCARTHALRRLAGVGIAAADQLEAACVHSPSATGDTLMGILPNLVAARVASALDLHGPSLAVDAGHDSGLAALDVAARYLLTGEIGIALVGAVCGHDTTSLPFAGGDAQAAEGAFLVALVRADTARILGLKPLARVAMSPSRTTVPAHGTAVFGAADRIIAVIRAIETCSGHVDIAPVEDTRSRTARLIVASSRPRTSAAARGRPRHLHEVGPDPGNGLAWSPTLIESDHALLSHHTVRGLPTVPGAILVELAIEAASELEPGLIPAAVTEVRFRRLVRTSADDRLPPIQVTATRDAAPSTVDPGAVAVRVAIKSAKGFSYAEMTVRLARTVAHVAAPDWPGPTAAALDWPGPTAAARAAPRDGPWEAVSDPYRISGSPVFLAGVFGALRQPRIHVDGASARYRVDDVDPALDLSSYRIPVIALDCLFRMFSLARCHRRRTLAVGVPVAATRIDLCTTCNDEEITHLFGELELRGDATGRTLVATAPDGRVLLCVTGLEMHELSQYRVDTREWSALDWPGPAAAAAVPASPERVR